MREDARIDVAPLWRMRHCVLEGIDRLVVPAKMIEKNPTSHLDDRCGWALNLIARFIPRLECDAVPRGHLLGPALSARGVAQVLEDVGSLKVIGKRVGGRQCERATILLLRFFGMPGPFLEQSELGHSARIWVLFDALFVPPLDVVFIVAFSIVR